MKDLKKDLTSVPESFTVMRKIQYNRLVAALDNFDKSIDENVYLQLQIITKEKLDVDIPLTTVIWIAYSDVFLHSELVEWGVEEMGGNWFDVMSLMLLNRNVPTFGDEFTEEELAVYYDRLKNALLRFIETKNFSEELKVLK